MGVRVSAAIAARQVVSELSEENVYSEEMVASRPDCAIPKMSSTVVRQHQNAGPKMRPFSEPSGNMPILRGTKNGSKFRVHFEAASRSFFELTILFLLTLSLQQQHSFLSCCRFMDNDSNNVLWLALEAHMSLPCAAYNFDLLSGSLSCVIVWNPIHKKTLNPTNVRFRLKARGIAIILNSCRTAETF